MWETSWNRLIFLLATPVEVQVTLVVLLPYEQCIEHNLLSRRSL